MVLIGLPASRRQAAGWLGPFNQVPERSATWIICNLRASRDQGGVVVPPSDRQEVLPEGKLSMHAGDGCSYCSLDTGPRKGRLPLIQT